MGFNSTSPTFPKTGVTPPGASAVRVRNGSWQDDSHVSGNCCWHEADNGVAALTVLASVSLQVIGESDQLRSNVSR